MKEICTNCNEREATENWIGTSSALEYARNNSIAERWCKRCVLEAQIDYAKGQSSRLPELEKQLSDLSDNPNPTL